MENEQPELADANTAHDPPRPINNNNREMFDQDAQPARRTIGDFGAPTTFFANRSAICPPPVSRSDYEIKSSIINLVKQHRFRGLPYEHPIKRSTIRLPQMQAICIFVSRQVAPLAQITTTRLTYKVGRMQSSFLKPLLHQVKDDDAKEQDQFIPTE